MKAIILTSFFFSFAVYGQTSRVNIPRSERLIGMNYLELYSQVAMDEQAKKIQYLQDQIDSATLESALVKAFVEQKKLENIELKKQMDELIKEIDRLNSAEPKTD